MKNSRRCVTFELPFALPELPNLQGAGTYIVATEAEEIHGSSPAEYRTVRTELQLLIDGVTQSVTVDPENLERALQQDGANAGMLRFTTASYRATAPTDSIRALIAKDSAR